MKSFLIIGMGKFGHHLCDDLLELGADLMVVDWKEENVGDLIYKVTNVQIGDCCDPKVIKSLGVANFDTVFVTIGSNFQSSLEVTSLVKEMGAKHVISKAVRDIQAKFLLRNGADEVIYPDRDVALTLAKKCYSDDVFEYVDLDDDYAIVEIATPEKWIGSSIIELDIRKTYNVSIIGIKTNRKTDILPAPSYVFTGKEHLMVLGADKDINGLVK